MHITDSLIAYDTGFPGYNIPSSGFPHPWQMMAGLRLTGNGIGVIDQQLTATGPSAFQMRMYRITASGTVGDPLTVSSAVNLSLDATDTTASNFSSACAVVGTSNVQLVTENTVSANQTTSLHVYTYDFSGTPSKTSSAQLPGALPASAAVGIPIVSLTSTLSVAIMNTNGGINVPLNLEWQWAEGYIQINSGTPAAITNVAAWHTTLSGTTITGPQYAITGAARLSATSFVVLATEGVSTGGQSPTVLMQMDLAGNITSQTTVPSAALAASGGHPGGFPPQFLFDTAGNLYLSYMGEAATTTGATGVQTPLVIALDGTTGQPAGGTFHQVQVVPLDSSHTTPINVNQPVNISGIGGGQWFLQTTNRICLAQQSTTDWVTGATTAPSFGTYIDPSFWGASTNHDYPYPLDFTPPGSIIGYNPGGQYGTGQPVIGAAFIPTVPTVSSFYCAVFAMSATTAVCIALDYTPTTNTYAAKAHSLFRVTTDPLFRPTFPPPTIVTPYYGQMTPVLTNPGPFPLFTFGFGFLSYDFAHSTVGVYTYSRGTPAVPPITAAGNTYFIGLTGGAYSSPTVDVDQNNPYAITVASTNSAGQPVYTQRFEINYLIGVGLGLVAEPTYTWRNFQVTWTYLPINVPDITGGWSIGRLRLGATGAGTGGGGGGGGGAITVPGQPTALTAFNGTASVTVTFNAPANTGGATIDTYRATVYLASTNAVVTTNSGSGSPITISGLIDGTAYYVAVAAHNSAGFSLESAPSNTVTSGVGTTGGGGSGGGGTGGGGSGGGGGGGGTFATGWSIPASTSVGLRSTAARFSLPLYTGSITTGQTIIGMKVNVPSFCPANVTFQGCWLYSTGGTSGQGNHIVDRPLSGLTLIDCELCPDGAVNPDSAAFSFGIFSFDNTATVNMTRCYIHNIGEGFRIGGPGLVQNVWIDTIVGSNFGGGSHNNCWIRQDNDTGATLTVDACWFWCSGDSSANTTADCLIQAPNSTLHPTDFGPVANVTITNNYWHLSSGVQATMAWDDQGPGISNVTCNNNRFDVSTLGYADPNSHGGSDTWTTSGNSWTNNFVNDPGQPNNQGAPIAPNT